jgi:hypothetical protein
MDWGNRHGPGHGYVKNIVDFTYLIVLILDLSDIGTN